MITIKEYTEQLETENRTLYEDKNYWKRLAEKRKFQLQQKDNIIKEVREEIRILNTNYDITDIHATKLFQILDQVKEI